MTVWEEELRQCCTDPAQIARRFGLDPASAGAVAERYPVRLTPHLLGLIEGPDDPLGRQFLPHPAELDEDRLPEDPLAEETLSPTPAIVHRYRDRVLLLAANTCAAYCRFCTRKRRVGCRGRSVAFGEILAAIEYVAANPEIREVIVSGGDPLLMADGMLGEILGRLRKIPHIGLLRVATRTPAVLPARITASLAELLRRFAPLFLTTHFNHPRELSAEAAEACARLVDAGIPLANQTVLLRGVNDDAGTLADLFQGLLLLRVRPYYLHHPDPVHGTAHFAVPLTRGRDIMQELWRGTSGLAIPHYVVDTPGGKGKVPVHLVDTVDK